jgi:opacity protein-like surface antigen
VGVGYDFGPMRTELTYSYENSQLSYYTDPSGTYGYQGGQQSTNSVLVSAYWDIDTHSRWTPYLGGGLGYGWQNQANSQDAFASYNGYGVSGLAWQAKAGLGYALTRQADLFAEFVYRGIGGFAAADGIATYNHSSLNRLGFQLGGHWRFGN